MKSLLLLSVFVLGGLLLQTCRLRAQEIPDRLLTSHAPLNKRLAKLVTVDEYAISPAESKQLSNPVYLDAREPAEYATSHLPGALHLGYNNPDMGLLDKLDRDQPVVVYCTVGYRSERAANSIRKMGFTQVYNLYGSIYAWKLKGFSLENAEGPTDRIHTYNKKWGSFVPDSIGEKVH